VGNNQPFREKLGGTASAAFTPACNLELEVLRARTDSKAETVGEVALAIGKLGGHLNRKGDGLPGWETLWGGMQTLSLLVEDVHIARKLTDFG
jgi:Transposase Tn5 dimerisation domain